MKSLAVHSHAFPTIFDAPNGDAPIGLLISLSVIALAVGQGGTGRTNANSAKPAPKRTTPAKKATRVTGSRPKPSPTQPSAVESTEPEFWETIRSSSDVQDFKDYLQAYPNGAHALIARTRIRQLEAAKTPLTKTSTANLSLPNARTNQAGIEFVLIPPGSFMMGSDNRDADEKPMHQVTINYSFYMGKYEVTQAQWQAAMGTSVRQQRDKVNPPKPMRGESDKNPMYYVNWNEAQEFVRKLNQMNDGYTYRLPTEAEWEYACRAGTTGDYAGNLSEMAWYSANSGSQTHAVGGKGPNDWGLADMHGNVWEWCEDWFHETYDGAPTDGSAWLSGGEKKHRVLRGGSWFNDAVWLRSANRGSNAPDQRDDLGFRVVAVVRTQ